MRGEKKDLGVDEALTDGDSNTEKRDSRRGRSSKRLIIAFGQPMAKFEPCCSLVFGRKETRSRRQSGRDTSLGEQLQRFQYDGKIRLGGFRAWIGDSIGRLDVKFLFLDDAGHKTATVRREQIIMIDMNNRGQGCR